MESSPFWNPESTELESGIQCSESGIHRVESRIQDCHGFPYMGRCLCFKPASRYLLFSKMNSRQENRSKPSFTARMITKYSLERFLSICGEKMPKGFLKFCKLISNLILRSLSQILQTCITKSLNSRVNYARLH